MAELSKTIKAYRYRGKWTLTLRRGESVEIQGETPIKILPQVCNVVRIRTSKKF